MFSPLRPFTLALALLCATCGSGEGARTIVFAASSLTEVFGALKSAFEKTATSSPISLHFAGTPTLLFQLREGAPASVFAAADPSQMAQAQALGLIDGEPAVFATNRITIATARGNPLDIRELGDLARADLRVALCAPEVPAGRYAREALASAGVRVASLSDEQSVRALTAKVALGELDAGIVYATDVDAHGALLSSVPIEDAHNVEAAYPIARLRGAEGTRTGAAFIAFVHSSQGRAILEQHGFKAPR